jgi:UDP-N-acetylglucosamine 2-epimerase
MPGSIISKESEFVEFFDDIRQGIDRTKEKREKLQLIFNKYNDGRNCERIAEAIGLCQ